MYGTGIVTDTLTGQVWQQTDDGVTRDWSTAIAYCDGLTLGGQTNWQLPTNGQLSSLKDHFDWTFFPGTKGSYYWSSTTNPDYNGEAFSQYFGSGFAYTSLHKTGAYFVRCMRKGPVNWSFGSFGVSSPSQAATVMLNTPLTVSWDPQNTWDQVAISLSRLGAKDGTWEPLTPGTANIGSFVWTVTGPVSEYCVLKIQSLADPTMVGYQGLFSIVTVDQFHITSSLKIPYSEYDLALKGLDSFGNVQSFAVPWTISDPTIATAVDTSITALKNGYVTATAEYNGRSYIKPFFFLIDPNSPDNYEGNINDTAEQADVLPANDFWQGQLLTNDTDYFRVDLAQNAVVDIGYLSDSLVSDATIEVVNSEGQVLAYATSINGEQKTLSCDLPAGSTYIRIVPAGDIDENGFYYLSWGIRQALPIYGVEKEPNNSEAQASTLVKDVTLYATMPTAEADWFRFSLSQAALVEMKMMSESTSADYHFTIYKGSEQFPLEDMVTADGKPAAIKLGLAAGDYLLKVESNGDLDSQVLYHLLWTTTDVSGHEIEPNNTLESANGLKVGLDQQGRIYSAVDQDIYGFNVVSTTGELATINFTPTTTTADYTIEMLNAAGNVIANKSALDGAAAFIKFKTTPGSYYFRVKNDGKVDQFANYTVSMSTTAEVSPLLKIDTLKVTTASESLNVQQSEALSVVAIYSDGSSLNVTNNSTFSSSAPAVATVDASGNVLGVDEGHVTVNVAFQDKAAEINLTVGSPLSMAKQAHGNLIIVAGGTLDANDTLKQATLHVSELAYQKFQARNFTDDDIYFMSQTAFHDLNGDGYDDQIVDDLTPTKDEVTTAITGWAKNQVSDGPLYIYLADHGAKGQFQVAKNEILTASFLKVALDDFQAATNRPVVVIIEACYSGSFVEPLTNATYDRLVLTSVDGASPGYLSSDGTTSYSSFLLANLYKGKSITDSLAQTKADLAVIGQPYKKMAPQTEGTEGLKGLKVGGDFVLAGTFPEFGEITPTQSITAGSLALNVHATALLGGLTVWAVIVPPDYMPPEVTGDFVSTVDELPNVVLVDEDPTTKVMDGQFAGNYDGFTTNGDYTVIFYAKDSDNNLVKSSPVTITVSGGTNVTTSTTTTTTTVVPNTTELPTTTTTTTIEQVTTSTTESTATTTTTSTSSSSPSTTTTIQGSTSVSLAIKPGWTLLASSIGFQATTVFGESENFTSVWKWTTGMSGKTWAVYLPGGDGGAAYANSKGFIPLTSIDSGEGFWVNSKFSKLLFVSGTPDYGELSFSKGWNLVGVKGTEPIAVTNLGSVTSVWKWTNGAGGKTWAVYLPCEDDKGASYAASKAFSQFTTIAPGEGFWVNKP